MGKMKNAYEVFVGKPEGKRPIGRPRHRWDDNILMDLMEISFWDLELDSYGLGKNLVAGSCEHGNEPKMQGLS
jgi:hypothetical protein